MERLRTSDGVEGTVFAVAEVSESGGDGGVASGIDVSDFSGGGVEVVGEESVVAEVDVSERGERGRSVSVDRKCEVFRS